LQPTNRLSIRPQLLFALMIRYESFEWGLTSLFTPFEFLISSFFLPTNFFSFFSFFRPFCPSVGGAPLCSPVGPSHFIYVPAPPLCLFLAFDPPSPFSLPNHFDDHRQLCQNTRFSDCIPLSPLPFCKSFKTPLPLVVIGFYPQAISEVLNSANPPVPLCSRGEVRLKLFGFRRGP